MTVRAKFYVESITTTAGGPAADSTGTVKLKPVCRGAHNADWAKATPGGEISLTINNPPAFAFFRDRLGMELAINFTPFDGPKSANECAGFRPHPRADDEESWYADKCGDCGEANEEHKA